MKNIKPAMQGDEQSRRKGLFKRLKLFPVS